MRPNYHGTQRRVLIRRSLRTNHLRLNLRLTFTCPKFRLHHRNNHPITTAHRTRSRGRNIPTRPLRLLRRHRTILNTQRLLRRHQASSTVRHINQRTSKRNQALRNPSAHRRTHQLIHATVLRHIQKQINHRSRPIAIFPRCQPMAPSTANRVRRRTELPNLIRHITRRLLTTPLHRTLTPTQ